MVLIRLAMPPLFPPPPLRCIVLRSASSSADWVTLLSVTQTKEDDATVSQGVSLQCAAGYEKGKMEGENRSSAPPTLIEQ